MNLNEIEFQCSPIIPFAHLSPADISQFEKDSIKFLRSTTSRFARTRTSNRRSYARYRHSSDTFEVRPERSLALAQSPTMRTICGTNRRWKYFVQIKPDDVRLIRRASDVIHENDFRDATERRNRLEIALIQE